MYLNYCGHLTFCELQTRRPASPAAAVDGHKQQSLAGPAADATAAPSAADGGQSQQYLGGPAAAAAGGDERERAATRARLMGAAMLGALSPYIVQPMPGT